jgi:hypothetical protein
MLSARLLIMPFLGLSALAGKPAVSGPEAVITRAAIAPFQDALRHDAAALCGDLAPVVAAELVRGAAPSVGCTAAASRDFALTAPDEPPAEADLSLTPTVQHLEVAERHATVELSFTFVTDTEKSGKPTAIIHSAGPIKLELEEVGGTWLLSSRATLATLPGCRLPKPRRCRPGARVLLFAVVGIERAQPGEDMPTPPAVKRAGGREQREFEAGKLVVAQSGCLACHRIGEDGNTGPGPNLTHIGSKLSEPKITHALVDPRAPMPSFRRLPAQKFHDVVRFLSLLRRGP